MSSEPGREQPPESGVVRPVTSAQQGRDSVSDLASLGQVPRTKQSEMSGSVVSARMPGARTASVQIPTVQGGAIVGQFLPSGLHQQVSMQQLQFPGQQQGFLGMPQLGSSIPINQLLMHQQQSSLGGAASNAAGSQRFAGPRMMMDSTFGPAMASVPGYMGNMPLPFWATPGLPNAGFFPMPAMQMVQLPIQPQKAEGGSYDMAGKLRKLQSEESTNQVQPAKANENAREAQVEDSNASTEPLRPTTGSKRSKRGSQPAPKRRSLSATGKKQSDEASGDSEDAAAEASASGLGGEHRLSIVFSSFGNKGNPPQTFGRNGYVIPDGLCGVHRMYSQEWRFEITHEKVAMDDHKRQGEFCTVLTWSITNLASGTTVKMTETVQQAIMRQSKGNTICNLVLKRAIENRIEELKLEIIAADKTPLQRANLESLLAELSPKKAGQGLLFFGLRHECIQQAQHTT